MLSNEQQLQKYLPAYQPLNTRPPTEAELRIDRSLGVYMERVMPLESEANMNERDTILGEVRSIFKTWVKTVAVDVLHMPVEEAESAGGELFISGSHRLGVRDIGADIDTICVAPNFCTREHFFSTLKQEFLDRKEVTELVSVEDAFVPVMSFDFRGPNGLNVSIDLLFARMAENTVPGNLNILDDKILTGLDEATEKSLNGPRVTNMIFELVGKEAFPNFLIVLRCIRKWAKARGIYGNKMGYLGGINCNIMVAFICQLYPKSGPSSLLYRFFKTYKDWNWPEPIMLNNIQQNPPGTLLSDERAVWSAKTNTKDLMPLITPAYPAMNSAFNVSAHSFEVMRQEIQRGYEVTEEIIKTPGEKQWDRLFEPSDFFLKYTHYLQCHIVLTGDNADSRSWLGFVESRIRRLMQYPYLETLPIKKPIHLFPVKSKTENGLSECYFVGFDLDLDQLRERQDKNIHIDTVAFHFQEALLDPERGYKGARVEGLDFYIEHMTWKRLPKAVFQSLGGFESAKLLRQARGYGVRKVVVAEEAKDSAPSGGFAESKTDDVTASTVKSEPQSGGKRGVAAATSSGALGASSTSSAVQYDLGKRHFSHAVYGEFGAEGVDTIEKSRKKLRAEAFGGEGLERGLFEKKPTLLRDLPALLPPARMAALKAKSGQTSGVKSGASRVVQVPNVTWTLLDGK